MRPVRPEATAHAPCHVSSFFVPHVVPREPEKTGSAGAGLCLAAGVTAHVTVQEADRPSVRVQRNAEGDARVTEAALKLVLGPRKLAVHCAVQEGAPLGQGFGISGASALAAGFALARCLGEGRSEALKAAHLAEVRQRSGLGDVVAQFLGGVVVRTAPGLPPWGSQQRLPTGGDVVVCTVGPPIETAGLLRDRARLAEVTRIGQGCMERLAANPSFEAIFEEGAAFARDTKLVDDVTLDAMDACAEGGVAMAAMLGNTVVAYGETDVLVDVLQGWGEPAVVPIDEHGLSLFRDEPVI